MDKKERQNIERAFFNYKKNKELAAKFISDFAESNFAISYDKPSVQSSGNKGKETQLCKAIDFTTVAYLWCKVVEHTLDSFRFDCKFDFILTYYIKRKGKIGTMQATNISERTFRYWRDEIMLRAYMWAKEYKVL